MSGQYQPRYDWEMTQIDAADPPTEFDWTGMDGVLAIGRIRKEMHGPTKGQWQWSGWYPKTLVGTPPTPNTGWVGSARIATQMVEEFWEQCHRVMRPRGSSS